MLMLRPPSLACWVHWRIIASQAICRQRSVAFRFLVVYMSRATSGVSRSSSNAVQLLLAITYQAGQLARPVLVAPRIDLFEQLERCPSTRLSVILTATSRTLQVTTVLLLRWQRGRMSPMLCALPGSLPLS